MKPEELAEREMIRCETCGRAYTKHDVTHSNGIVIGCEKDATITSCYQCAKGPLIRRALDKDGGK